MDNIIFRATLISNPNFKHILDCLRVRIKILRISNSDDITIRWIERDIEEIYSILGDNQ